MPTGETQTIPYKITDYIREHFREDFLFEVKRITHADGHPQYEIEVSKDDYIYRLKFNEKGDLIKEDAEQAFPADDHEGRGFGEVPD